MKVNGLRLYGGTSFHAYANNTKEEYVTSREEDCPNDAKWKYPWEDGDRCVVWEVSAKIPSEELLYGPPVRMAASSSPRARSIAIQVTRCLRALLTPPLKFYCKNNEDSFYDGCNRLKYRGDRMRARRAQPCDWGSSSLHEFWPMQCRGRVRPAGSGAIL